MPGNVFDPLDCSSTSTSGLSLSIVIGDVTDKGIPAALIMATTCAMLRTAALAMDSPEEVLDRVNDLLYAGTPV